MLINSIIFFSALGMILSTGSVYFDLYGRDFFPIITIFLMSFLIFWRFIINYRIEEKISYTGFIGILMIVIIPFIIDLINIVQSFQILFFHILVILLSFFIGNKYQEKMLKSYFIIILIISSISLLYFFTNLFWGIENFLNPIYKSNRWNALVFPLWAKYDHPIQFFSRNMAIFFEPGAFAFHLIPSITLAIKYKKYKPLLIFITAAITTFSTSMYIALILFGLFGISYQYFKKIKIRYFLLIFSFILIGFNSLNIQDQDWSYINLAKNVIFDKFTNDNFSYSGRLSYSKASLEMFLNSNLMGFGHYSSEYMLDFDKMEGHATTTSAFFGLIADLGLFGIFCIVLYTRFFNLFGLFSIPITFVWLNSEFMPYNYFTLFLLAYISTNYFPKLFDNRSNLIFND